MIRKVSKIYWFKWVEGEKGYTTLERTSIRPTLDANGIWGGYTGEGAKTVIPSKAFAKISMRLVPYQTPEEITEKFTKYFHKIAPENVKVKVTPHHGGMPYVLPSDSEEFLAAKKQWKRLLEKKFYLIEAVVVFLLQRYLSRYWEVNLY